MRVEIREGFPIVEAEIRCPEEDEEVRRAALYLRGLGKQIIGVKDGAAHLIEPRGALYFESVDRKCFIYTENTIYETPLKLYEIEETLSDCGFFRSSKSQIVNIIHISSLCPDFDGRLEVRLKNGEKLIVSRQYARKLKERIGLR
jgi:DNA-binding LytR/AlgR family response regulator